MPEKPPEQSLAPPPHPHHQSFWLWVMCLTGVDYFSTLGYQPSIAYEATGRLAPLATVLLVAMTLLGALPVYAYVARRSPHGQGSVGMLEKLMRGWRGKFLVLGLLGFAATDFVITKTLSAADATVHLLENPIWPIPAETIDHHHQQLWITFVLLVLLGATFMRGFKEVIGLAVIIVGVYLVLNLIIIGSGVSHLLTHPDRLNEWLRQVRMGPGELRSGPWAMKDAPPIPVLGGGLSILLVCLLLFPKLALGLSGFETGVAVMPLVKGKEGAVNDDPHARDHDSPEELEGRIRNTRKLLITAALIMSVMLLGSSLTVSTLIKPSDLIGVQSVDGKDVMEDGKKPRAKDRALAFIAHGESVDGKINPLFGPTFGTIYDISTIVILWFAGASAMAGLLNLVPQYLPRYGMAPEWAGAIRPLVFLFTGINLFVTWVFDADVTKQGGAYATGVLVLMTSACVATVIQKYRDGEGNWSRRMPWYFLFITLVFVYTTVAIVIEKPDGIKIAACFLAAILVSSIISRTLRSTELRFKGFEFKDEHSRFLWESMKMLEFPVLVPHRPGRRGLESKEDSIRSEHRLDRNVEIVFLEVSLGDVSEFYQQPCMEVIQESGRYILRITRANSIAHVITAVGLELSKVGKPPEIHFGWSDETPMAANLNFLLFGVGNVPWMVRELILKAEPNPERQPRVVIG